ncbi:probable serine incorporator [Chenopodium quinoa]|uniref:probable serine incorporator n=1 Tax=Chenopodium quinoa TaxID=63459 RepID=UPI000B79664A|nr:probable serine incorporator [Chenopodium quinoa]XP_021723683.1 probable serine incorporator [Chenopodium quinoa]XP_021723684.1 probable serine incorporator [Chenopodium quinoa]XP_021723685.1 probable serine incorporator [Chenopodium quinoa]
MDMESGMSTSTATATPTTTAIITVKEKYPGVIKDGSWFAQFRYGCNPWMARYVYGFIFLITNFLAWAVRDYGKGAMKEMARLRGCKAGTDCLGTEGVLRVSMGCFLFFFAMFLSTVGTSKVHDQRDTWHSGWWSAKSSMFFVLMMIPFLLPTPIVEMYGEIAHFGAGIFLLIQLVSVISFIFWLNDSCQSEKYADRCRVHMMFTATTAYVLSIVGIILMYIWYAPETSCLQNIFFITWTLVLLQLMTSVSMQPRISAGYLTPGLMGLYIVYLCWGAIRSEPPGTKCNKRSEGSNQTDWLTIISFVVALLTIVIATFSTGIDSQCFQFKKKDKQPDDDGIPYGYGFFHFVFATGAMYFAMLLIGWNTHHAMKKWTIDVGWTSTWVRVVNEWIAACVYIWMLVAPVILKSRQADEFP